MKIFFLATLIGLILTCSSCGSGVQSGNTSGIAGTIGTENVLLTSAQMLSDGFSYGPIDGTIGVIYNAGTYTLLGSGYKTTGGVQGAFSFTGDLTSITGSPLTPLVTDGSDPNGYVFDLSYTGGGPTIPLYNGTVLVGYLMSYHGEYWCNGANNHGAFPTLFQKYYQGSFSQPGTSSNADNSATSASNSGHFTAIVADNSPLYPSVVFVTALNEFLMTYSTGNNQINFQTGANLLSWSGNISSMQINQSGWTMLEPSLLGESTDPLTSNGFPYVYYVKSNNWLVNNWRSAEYVYRQISF